MAKSLRSKREKRLRAIRGEIVEKETFYDKKEAAKYAAQQAAVAAPKLPSHSSSHLSAVASPSGSASTSSNPNNSNMDVDIAGESESMDFLKPVGGVGKKFKRKFKVGKCKRHGKGKGKGNARRNRHI